MKLHWALGRRVPGALTLAGLIALAAIACGADETASQPAAEPPAASGSVESEGASMTDDGQAMDKESDAMAMGDKDAMTEDSMADEHDKMDKDPAMMEGDSMKEKEGAMMDDGSSIMEGDAMAKDGAMVEGVEVPPFINAPHFVNSFPEHGETLAQAPNSLVVNFNFNLHPQATAARVTRNGSEVPSEATVSDDRFTLTVDLMGAQGDGVWAVELDACWPDGSCHQGQFAFTVDSSMATAYRDYTGMADVKIGMEDIDFDEPNVVIDSGTTVTWVNHDSVEHFVNSDPHPSHNVVPSLNSVALGEGDSYSFTFSEPGLFGYHCSAHTHMIGNFLVRG